MRRFSMLMLAMTVFFGLALVGRAGTANGQDAPPPNQGGPGGGPGGGSGPGGRPPGGVHLIPRFAQDKLNLTEEQKTQVAELEKECKEKLAKILTPEQMKTLEEARPMRGGPGGPGGGQGGPGGGQGGPGGGQGGPGGGPGGPGGGQGGPGGGQGGPNGRPPRQPN